MRLYGTNPKKNPVKCMKTLAFCKKNGWVMQNHQLGIQSDKIWENSTTQNTLKYLTTYCADPPNWPKYLGHLKKKTSVVHVWGYLNRKNESTSKMDGPLLSFKIHVVALKVHLLFNWRQIDTTVKINLTEKLKHCSPSIFKWVVL